MNWRELTEITETLEKAFDFLKIDYYLIGAMARQYWFDEKNVTSRMTTDIDYAIFIGSEEEYQNARDYLIENAGYIPTKTNAFVLITPSRVQIDLLPFGEIQKSDKVTVEGLGLTSINMEGMKDVYDSGIQTIIKPNGKSFKIATLPSIVLLKLIAYSDRPEHRQKDALDIGNIIMCYFALSDDEIYEKHHDLFKIDQTLEEIGSTVIGREMALILAANKELKGKIISLLETQIDLSENSSFNKLMSTGTNRDIETITELLKKMLWGLNNQSKIE